MKIAVLIGSPKGKLSVTSHYVHFVQTMFPGHELDIIHVAQRIKKIEQDEQTFQEIVDRVQASDGVLWAFSMAYFFVHANYKRFIELIWERGAKDAFKGKYTAVLSTSMHLCDHLAHNYVRAICDDLEMQYVDAFSADTQDLMKAREREKLLVFAEDFITAIQHGAPTSKRYVPLVSRDFEYIPAPAQGQIDANGKKIVLVTDAKPHQANLLGMIERFRVAFSQDIDIVNLHELDIKGSCLHCLKCAPDNQCAYLGKDEYVDFYNAKLKPADIIIFAGGIKDRHLASTWHTFFGRSYFNTNSPSLIGKQFGFIIAGPLGQVPNLRQSLDNYVQFQRSNLAGLVTDEFGDSVEIDRLLQNLAERLVRFSASGYIKPPTFFGVAGAKLIRDVIWNSSAIFKADHRVHKELQLYDFPQKDLKARITNLIWVCFI